MRNQWSVIVREQLRSGGQEEGGGGNGELKGVEDNEDNGEDLVEETRGLSPALHHRNTERMKTKGKRREELKG